MFESLNFQGKLWQVIAKVKGHHIGDPSTLKNNYNADLVIKNHQNIFFMLNEIIDVEWEDI